MKKLAVRIAAVFCAAVKFVWTLPVGTFTSYTVPKAAPAKMTAKQLAEIFFIVLFLSGMNLI